MLEFACIDGVEDPIEAKDRVEDHGNVVDPRALVAEDIAKKGILCIRITKTYT